MILCCTGVFIPYREVVQLDGWEYPPFVKIQSFTFYKLLITLIGARSHLSFNVHGCNFSRESYSWHTRRLCIDMTYSDWKPKLLFACQVAPSHLCHFSTELAEIWSPGCQAHFLKVVGHTKKIQFSISCTFKDMKLLVEIT